METRYFIAWWERIPYADGQVDVDGFDFYMDDHYEPCSSLAEAQDKLPHFQVFDEDAHILDMED